MDPLIDRHPETLSTAQPAESAMPEVARVEPAGPTFWGLPTEGLHRAFWHTCRIAVVRHGATEPGVGPADLYLLLPDAAWVWFDPDQVGDTLRWLKPQVLNLRVSVRSPEGYAERVVMDDTGQFQGIERRYGHATEATYRATLVRSRTLAEAWQRAPDLESASTVLRTVPRAEQTSLDVAGRFFDSERGVDAANTMEGPAAYLRLLATRWRDPHDALWNTQVLGPGVFAAPDCEIAPTARLVGPLWIGRGQRIGENAVVVGPQVLPDLAGGTESKTKVSPPARVMVSRPAGVASGPYALKRPLDLLLAGLGLLISLPLWPLIIAAILIEGGGKPFLSDRRQSKGGRPFDCFKFRSIRSDGDVIHPRLPPDDEPDPPQDRQEEKPQLTRVGSVLRRFGLDELPRLLNVIRGDMSLVGPRAGSNDEDPHCPAWRDARLSVRPGLTGIWRVSRTRPSGQGFTDWIRDDLEYVETQSLFLDARIILKTIGRGLRPAGKPSIDGVD